jgi:hypothetical protein
MKPSRETYVPSHPTLFLVEFGSAEFDSCLRAQKVSALELMCRAELNSLKSFEAGEIITQLKGLSKGPKAYTSVQCGTGSEDHIELNSDLVFGRSSAEILSSFAVT